MWKGSAASRGWTQWLLILLMIAMFAAGVDYGVFAWRQRHGEVLSFTYVKQYVAVSDGNGHYHIQYFGRTVVPCIDALLPHQRLSPCWWVSLHREHWE